MSVFMATFRINYGNGQCTDNFKSLAAVKRACIAQADYSAAIGQSFSGWVQEYMGDGEWFSGHLKPADRKPHEHR